MLLNIVLSLKYWYFLETSYWFYVTGGQEQQSMKEILATLARTSEGSDQLPSYEGLSISLLNNFDHHIYPSDLQYFLKLEIFTYRIYCQFHG